MTEIDDVHLSKDDLDTNAPLSAAAQQLLDGDDGPDPTPLERLAGLLKR